MPTAIHLTRKLDAINAMLIGIGEAPVNTLNSGLQEAEIAEITLDNMSREVQSQGWTFNTDIRKTLVKLSSGKIPIPNNTLELDTLLLKRNYNSDIIQRGGYLYDRTKNTDIFTADVVVDIVYLLAFEKIPEVARRYITLRAGRKFQEDSLGSDTMTQLQLKDEQAALFALRNSDSQSADFNIFDEYDTYRALDRGSSTSSLLKSQRILYS